MAFKMKGFSAFDKVEPDTGKIDITARKDTNVNPKVKPPKLTEDVKLIEKPLTDEEKKDSDAKAYAERHGTIDRTTQDKNLDRMAATNPVSSVILGAKTIWDKLTS